jgi:glycogen debranching enzyme
VTGEKVSPALSTLILKFTIFLLISGSSLVPAMAQEAPRLPELSRPVRSWEFLPVVGTRAGMFGDEAGHMEAWVYPLKIFRNLHLEFEVEGRTIPAETLARTINVRPESATIVYAGDTFRVRETFFVPVQEAGAVILFDVEGEHPINIRVLFESDFQLEWPAGLGATYVNWDDKLHAFAFGEEQKKYSALVGSSTAGNEKVSYQTNYSYSNENAFELGVTTSKKESRMMVIAGSVHGPAEAESTYQFLTANYSKLQQEAVEYYGSFLQRTVNLELPDPELQKAYDWSRISLLQGLVNNPFLGTGLIAGYRTSGISQRPGFAWFFGRDALWSSFALNAEGDYANARSALEFLSHFQREDGKIPHEIAQTASLVDWFKQYPYPYASADATPLYIIAVNDYVRSTGDTGFAKDKWDSLWKAYQFLRSTYDDQGLPKNYGIGHGWVEGGPLLPVKSELYQAGLGAEALRALGSLAHFAGKDDVSGTLSQEFSQHEQLINQAYWIADKNRFAFALDTAGQPIDEPTVLSTVPMWFGLLRDEKALPTIRVLSAPEHQSDWGMRIISSEATRYSGGGYHYGSVWPQFTGWATVAEYRYHRAWPAYANLRANALLALDGSLGHVTEVLSGDYYQPLSTSSPHQIWSAAMVISPMLRGLFGLSLDEGASLVSLSPHIPANWKTFAIKNVHTGPCVMDIRYKKTDTELSIDTNRTSTGECTLEFSPAISPLAEVTGAEMNGHLVSYRMLKSADDEHVVIKYAVPHGAAHLSVMIRNDFGLSWDAALPALGSTSHGLRVLNDTWSANHDLLELQIAGAAGSTYELGVWNAGSLNRVEGAELVKAGGDPSVLRIRIPASSAGGYARQKISFHFSGKSTP